MRSLAGSAFLLGVVLSAALVAAAPRGPTPVRAASATTGQSPPQAAKAARTPRGSRIAQASAGTADEIRPAESSGPVDAADSVCQALAAAAGANDLPIDFFTRLIWQESRFDPKAVSRAGAQGVAQFMPATASRRGLADPFDPVEAIAKSAQLLRDLRRDFGNLGLAAAAYNAGPGRVRDWLAGRRRLPDETRAYVRLITGRSAEEWTGGEAVAEMNVANGVPCRQMSSLLVHPNSRAAAPGAKPVDPWGVELVGSSSEATALAAYRQLQQKHSILAGREPRVVRHGLVRGAMGWARIRVGAESRASAERLCADLRAAGASCEVQRN
jgi:transglycosylase-like protein with SLT domain/sporulation related protein